MINELIVLADELDRLGEKQAADFVDKLIKVASDEDEEEYFLPPLKSEEPSAEDEFVDEVTKTDLAPLLPLKELLDEQRQKLERTFVKDEKRSGEDRRQAPKKVDPRDMLARAMQMISGATPDNVEGLKNQVLEMLETAKNSMH